MVLDSVEIWRHCERRMVVHSLRATPGRRGGAFSKYKPFAKFSCNLMTTNLVSLSCAQQPVLTGSLNIGIRIVRDLKDHIRNLFILPSLSLASAKQNMEASGH